MDINALSVMNFSFAKYNTQTYQQTTKRMRLISEHTVLVY